MVVWRVRTAGPQPQVTALPSPWILKLWPLDSLSPMPISGAILGGGAASHTPKSVTNGQINRLAE